MAYTVHSTQSSLVEANQTEETDSPCPDVSDLVEISQVSNADALCFTVRIRDGRQRELALLLAERIVQRAVAPTRTLWDAWKRRAQGGKNHPDEVRAALEAYIMADFHDEPRVVGSSGIQGQGTRPIGAVVEHLWAAVAPDLEGAWGRPLHTEHDHFSVIDHGPDGLTIHESEEDALRFRLWECKQSTGKQSLTHVFTKAAGQLETNGAEYLARVSKVLQLHSDARIQELAGSIVYLWTSKDPRGAVGVSVGRNLGDPLPSRPLRGLVQKFRHLPTGGHEAVLVEMVGLVDFVRLVRKEIRKGIY